MALLSLFPEGLRNKEDNYLKSFNTVACDDDQ